MKKQLLLLMILLLPLGASAIDIAVENADGVTIYYNYINNGKELEVTSKIESGNTECYSGNIVVPDEVTYMGRTRKVTRIGSSAFSGCSRLTSINIGNSVTYIGMYAFKRCSRLTSFTIPNSVMYIGEEAFSDCSGLTSVTIPNNVTSIGNRAFLRCSGLISVTIGNNVTSIGGRAFSGCSGLTSITIPNSVTSIGEYTFSGCSGLTSVTIPNSVTRIGESAFFCCSGLTSITIPNSVTSIGDEAFAGCSLTSITIPNSVTSIGDGAFYGCDIPTVISLIENPFEIGGKTSESDRVFSLNTYNNATLYVPKGTIDKYKATKGWKDFLFIEEGTGGGDTPTTQTCEKPTIGYVNGKLIFTSATEGAACYYSITDADIKAGIGNEVQLGVTYNISVYAAKEGFENSETTTATLCWIDAAPKTEGITDGVMPITSRAALIQSAGGFLKVEGVDEGTPVFVYTLDGKLAGSAVCRNGAALVGTNIKSGNTAIVKIGNKSVKVIMK